MATIVLDSMLLGIGIALNPAAVIASILVITRARSARPGGIFLAGWISGLLMLVILPSLLIMEGVRRLVGSTDWMPSWVWVALGAAVIVTAFLTLRGRASASASTPQPRWVEIIAAGGPGRIFGLGVTLSLASVRNIVLLAAAVAVISGAGLDAPGVVITAAIFLATASLGVISPLLVFALGGDNAAARLAAGSGWLQRNLIWLKFAVLILAGAVMVMHGLRLRLP